MTEQNCVLDHRVNPDRPRRAIDGLYLCAGHRSELTRLVAEMPAKADGLRRARGGSGPRPIGSHADLSVDEGAAAHRSKMTAVVASWCRVVAEDHNITPPDSVELARTCTWLIPHLDWCAGNRWVDEMLGELRDLTTEARRLTDIRARRVPTDAQCTRHRDGTRCEGVITIVVRGNDWVAYCSDEDCDGPQLDVAPYMRAVRRDVGVTAEDVVVMAGRYGIAVNDDVLRQWRHRKKITAQVIGGVVWYDLASVADYLARRKAQRERIAS
jgi:hypothetical protein